MFGASFVPDNWEEEAPPPRRPARSPVAMGAQPPAAGAVEDEAAAPGVWVEEELSPRELEAARQIEAKAQEKAAVADEIQKTLAAGVIGVDSALGRAKATAKAKAKSTAPAAPKAKGGRPKGKAKAKAQAKVKALSLIHI